MRSLLPLTIVAALGLAIWLSPSAGVVQADVAPVSEFEPVDPSMHEFMEYVFQPTYRRLKEALASEPADRPAWSRVKADAMILAEGGNLLLMRLPEEGADDWKRFSLETRAHGGEMYRSAKARDYAATRQHYETMLVSCNACHQQFADGKHQLKP